MVEGDGRAKGRPGARCLSGLRAVRDHFAVSWEQIVGMLQRFRRDLARPGDPGRSRLDIPRRGQDQIPHAMRDEALFGVADEGVRVQGEPAQGPERSSSQGPARAYPEPGAGSQQHRDGRSR
jgi:hypothetical protein